MSFTLYFCSKKGPDFPEYYVVDRNEGRDGSETRKELLFVLCHVLWRMRKHTATHTKDYPCTYFTPVIPQKNSKEGFLHFYVCDRYISDMGGLHYCRIVSSDPLEVLRSLFCFFVPAFHLDRFVLSLAEGWLKAVLETDVALSRFFSYDLYFKAFELKASFEQKERNPQRLIFWNIRTHPGEIEEVEDDGKGS